MPTRIVTDRSNYDVIEAYAESVTMYENAKEDDLLKFVDSNTREPLAIRRSSVKLMAPLRPRI